MEITSSEILDDDDGDDIELVASCKSIHPCKPKISGSVSVLQIRCLLAWAKCNLVRLARTMISQPLATIGDGAKLASCARSRDRCLVGNADIIRSFKPPCMRKWS